MARLTVEEVVVLNAKVRKDFNISTEQELNRYTLALRLGSVGKIDPANIAKVLATRYPNLDTVAIIEASRSEGVLELFGVTDVKQVWEITMALKELKS